MTTTYPILLVLPFQLSLLMTTMSFDDRQLEVTYPLISRRFFGNVLMGYKTIDFLLVIIKANAKQSSTGVSNDKNVTIMTCLKMLFNEVGSSRTMSNGTCCDPNWNKTAGNSSQWAHGSEQFFMEIYNEKSKETCFDSMTTGEQLLYVTTAFAVHSPDAFESHL